jgi:hypothetical protein
MELKDIVNNIAAGDSAAAKEGIENVLSAKAFDALQGRKQEMAATIFGGQEQSDEEVTDDEEAYAEEVEYDGEQLDELSKATLSSYAKKAVGDYGSTSREEGEAGSTRYGSERLDKRERGIDRAIDKLASKKTKK